MVASLECTVCVISWGLRTVVGMRQRLIVEKKIQCSYKIPCMCVMLMHSRCKAEKKFDLGQETRCDLVNGTGTLLSIYMSHFHVLALCTSLQI